MIAISNAAGDLIKILPPMGGPTVYGFHQLFGFSTEAGARQRAEARKRHGLRGKVQNWVCQFQIIPQASGDYSVKALSHCQARREGADWILKNSVGEFKLSATLAAQPFVPHLPQPLESKTISRLTVVLTILSLIIPVWRLLNPPEVKEEEKIEIVKVEVVRPPNAVRVPLPEALSSVERVAKDVSQEDQMRRAIKNNLGFLGLVGRKNLTKALGGAPSQLKDASPGAGAGGTEGSGGEYLVGLGKGLRQTTVGNTGVAGLGGIGTKGRGGGQGGYGNALVASGEGGKISDIPLSNDVILEGGLSKAVIQATIAKYLSQVRACYENGLRSNPALTGIVAMAFQINGMGSVVDPRVQQSSLGHPGVEGCIQNRMKTWQFPKPVGGVNVKVNYPFLLRPVSS